MSATLREGELQISLPKSAQGRKFDDETHGMSHCMKAVDWIIDLPDKVYMVEVKDLDAIGASGSEEGRKYLEDLEAGRKDHDFVAKFRDSFIYQWACERVDKPIIYLVIIACEALDNPMLQRHTDQLRRKLPSGCPRAWKRAIADGVLVFNERTWNEHFPSYPMERMSYNEGGHPTP